MYNPYEAKQLDVIHTRELIKECEVKRTPHLEDVELRKGRPEWSLIEDYLKDKLHKLYKVVEGRRGRIILLFYLSKKYDLKIIARLEEKSLYVVTYYYNRKR